MKTFFVNASLPDEYIDVLAAYGRCVKLPVSATVPLPVGAHPDTLVGRIGKTLYVSSGDAAIAETLRAVGADVRASDHESGAKYPLDCALNFFTVKNFLVGNLRHLAKTVVDDAVKAGYEPINVAQGYAHCACAVAGDCVITADEGIFDALTARGVNTLLIKSGGVSLPPYKYGFIGGACGNIDEKTLFFFGDLSTHESGSEILRFCRENGVGVINGKGKLADFGGVVSIDI